MWMEGNIKPNLEERGCHGVDLDRLPQYRIQWWAFVNTEINFGVHKWGETS